MINRRKGGIELIYIVSIIVLSSLLISNFHNNYRNLLKLTNATHTYNQTSLDILNINSEISKSIVDKNYEGLSKIDGYDVSVEKIIENFSDNEKKEFIKDYSNISIEDINNKTDFVLDKKSNKNYFLFSNSTKGLVVSDKEGNPLYSLGVLEDNMYFGIEKNSSYLENTSLYIKSSNETDKLLCFEFDPIIFSENENYYNFYVAKLEREDKIHYTLYIENNTSIIEIYSF